MTAGPCWLRADLHVHSRHSGFAGHLRFLRARDCYSEPEAVYRAAKTRGMDLVTITDHDSISGCLELLDRRPGAADVFISEEIECLFPDTHLRAHIGAYGIDERIHREVQPLRRNVFDVAAYLRQQGIFATINHLFFFFDRQMPLRDYLNVTARLGIGYEARNGTMLRAHNALVEEIAETASTCSASPVATVGGSDAHTLKNVATTYTEAPGLNVQDFLDSLRAGRARACGRHGGAIRVASEIYGVVGRYWYSLLGGGRQELTWRRRALGLAFSLASAPALFIPFLTAIGDKRREARVVASARHEWSTLAPRARELTSSEVPLG